MVPFDSETFDGGYRLVHVYSDYARKEDTLRRHELAKASWQREYDELQVWVPCAVPDLTLSRNSSTALGDTRAMPFVGDLIEVGISKACPADAIVLTNDDTCFVKGLTCVILNRIQSAGAAFAYRWDFPRLEHLLDRAEIRKGRRYPGSDLFAFTATWWKAHRSEWPDMLLGCEAWDWIMRELVCRHGGVELCECIFHEQHQPFWATSRFANLGNRHNRRLARQWLRERNLPLSVGRYSIAGAD